jgi:hypothetical protein
LASAGKVSSAGGVDFFFGSGFFAGPSSALAMPTASAIAKQIFNFMVSPV